MRALISHHNNCYNGLQRPVDAHNPYRTAVTDTARRLRALCGASVNQHGIARRLSLISPVPGC